MQAGSPKIYDVILRLMVPMWLHSKVKAEAAARGSTMSAIVRETLYVRFPQSERGPNKEVL